MFLAGTIVNPLGIRWSVQPGVVARLCSLRIITVQPPASKNIKTKLTYRSFPLRRSLVSHRHQSVFTKSTERRVSSTSALGREPVKTKAKNSRGGFASRKFPASRKYPTSVQASYLSPCASTSFRCGGHFKPIKPNYLTSGLYS